MYWWMKIASSFMPGVNPSLKQKFLKVISSRELHLHSLLKSMGISWSNVLCQMTGLSVWSVKLGFSILLV
jgi:hypothetical protein